MVARRRKEIGVRIALVPTVPVCAWCCAKPSCYWWWGFGIGAVLAFWAGRAAATLLFGLKPYDPTSMLGAMMALSIVALASLSARGGLRRGAHGGAAG
jgi:hypothetical protein